MKKILVVDLCGTIVRRNTTHDFMLGSGLPSCRRIGARMVLSRAFAFLCRYLPAGIQRALLVACLRGVKRDDLFRLSADYARACLATHPRKEVLQRIAAARENGVPVLLASASLDFIVSAFARELDVEVAVSTRLRYREDGSCAGAIERDATAHKLEFLRAYLGGSEFEFDVITDNPEDSDLMGLASDVWFIHAQD